MGIGDEQRIADRGGRQHWCRHYRGLDRWRGHEHGHGLGKCTSPATPDQHEQDRCQGNDAGTRRPRRPDRHLRRPRARTVGGARLEAAFQFRDLAFEIDDAGVVGRRRRRWRRRWRWR
jgi:hypothetical protein